VRERSKFCFWEATDDEAFLDYEDEALKLDARVKLVDMRKWPRRS
jgi:hypothetical protein